MLFGMTKSVRIWHMQGLLPEKKKKPKHMVDANNSFFTMTQRKNMQELASSTINNVYKKYIMTIRHCSAFVERTCRIMLGLPKMLRMLFYP